jgi:PIN domain nuclease of toxin-antitoxin system
MIVLDTHAWVWWLTRPEKLGKKAARVLRKAPRVGVPAICVWEVAMKAAAGKLKFIVHLLCGSIRPSARTLGLSSSL